MSGAWHDGDGSRPQSGVDRTAGGQGVGSGGHRFPRRSLHPAARFALGSTLCLSLFTASLFLASLFLASWAGARTPPTTAGATDAAPAGPRQAAPSVRFTTWNLTLSPSAPLAAWQVELAPDAGGGSGAGVLEGPMVVGIEGGDGVFAEPAHHDPASLSGGRVVLGAYSLESSERLPAGPFRAATIHVREPSGPATLSLRVRVEAAAGPDGAPVTVHATLVPARPRIDSRDPSTPSPPP